MPISASCIFVLICTSILILWGGGRRKGGGGGGSFSLNISRSSNFFTDIDFWISEVSHSWALNFSLYFNPILDGHFGTAPGICHTYPKLMKLVTVILYLRKIQKIYKSRDIPLEFGWYQHFLSGIRQILLYLEIQI